MYSDPLMSCKYVSPILLVLMDVYPSRVWYTLNFADLIAIRLLKFDY